MVAARVVLARVLKRTSSRLVLFASLGMTTAGALGLLSAAGYGASLAAALAIGAGLAAGFPVVLGYIGDRNPQQSGTAFGVIFVVALVGNMAINKTFGFVAQMYGVQQYPIMMLGCLACAAVLLLLVVRQLSRTSELENHEHTRQAVA